MRRPVARLQGQQLREFARRYGVEPENDDLLRRRILAKLHRLGGATPQRLASACDLALDAELPAGIALEQGRAAVVTVWLREQLASLSWWRRLVAFLRLWRVVNA